MSTNTGVVPVHSRMAEVIRMLFMVKRFFCGVFSFKKKKPRQLEQESVELHRGQLRKPQHEAHKLSMCPVSQWFGVSVSSSAQGGSPWCKYEAEYLFLQLFDGV